MLTIVNRSFYSLLVVSVFFVSLTTAAEQNQSSQFLTDEQKMEEVRSYFESEYQEEDYFRTDRILLAATKSKMHVRDAPAIATVITYEEIKNMGARNLLDVLKHVPGFGVTRSYFSLYEVEVRGMKTPRNEKIKLMLDGHSLNYPVWGGAAWAYETLALDQVERIEIIRGPGSALYGANAFSAVINVVTKMGHELNGTEAAIGLGSFDGKRYHLSHGGIYGNLDFLASATFSDVDSADLNVKSDLLGITGKTDDWAESWDIGLKIGWNDFLLNTRFLKRSNGPYIGVQYVLNDDSELDTEQYVVDLSYAKKISKKLSMNAKVYYDYLDMDLHWEIFPEGVPLLIGMGPLGWGPGDNMLAEPAMKNKRYGFEMGGDYELLKNNLLTAGFVLERVKHDDLEYHANFNPLTSEFLGSYQDVLDIASWGVSVTRDIWAVYLQDQWDISQNLHFTAGVRYDHYDDFGGITNPRIGFVWNLSKSAEIKLLYGKGFRAPNFEELYLINNPATKGNPDLDPEKIHTYEASIGWRPSKSTEISISGFHNSLEDRIDLIAIEGGVSEFRNAGDATIYGIESEIRYHLPRIESYANFTWQKPEDDETDDRIEDVPSFKCNLGLNLKIHDYLNGNINVLYVGDRPRKENDPRKDLESYAVIDTTLILQNFFKSLEISGSVYNVLDEDYSYPAPAATLADDYPALGRTFFIEARYIF